MLSRESLLLVQNYMGALCEECVCAAFDFTNTRTQLSCTVLLAAHQNIKKKCCFFRVPNDRQISRFSPNHILHIGILVNNSATNIFHVLACGGYMLAKSLRFLCSCSASTSDWPAAIYKFAVWEYERKREFGSECSHSGLQLYNCTDMLFEMCVSEPKRSHLC